jgi:hypothetical protein
VGRSVLPFSPTDTRIRCPLSGNETTNVVPAPGLLSMALQVSKPSPCKKTGASSRIWGSSSTISSLLIVPTSSLSDPRPHCCIHAIPTVFSGMSSVIANRDGWLGAPNRKTHRFLKLNLNATARLLPKWASLWITQSVGDRIVSARLCTRWSAVVLHRRSTRGGYRMRNRNGMNDGSKRRSHR